MGADRIVNAVAAYEIYGGPLIIVDVGTALTFCAVSKEIIIPFDIEFPIEGVKISIPKIGDKKKLLDLGIQNAKQYKIDKLKRNEKLNPEQKSIALLKEIQDKLKLDKIPMTIDCFDISNIAGTNAVAACVVFKNGLPSKQDYRHFAIKTVEGPNDFASMNEVVTRRYRRLLRENASLPQLVVIDGGKGQLSAAFSALEALDLIPSVTVIGLAKRLEEIVLPTDKTPLFLDKNSSSLRLIMHLRNEAHRFGITFHRKKRSAGFARSVLLDVPGIGPRAMEKLLDRFGSLKRIAAATQQDLSGVIPAKTAERLREYLKAHGTGS